MNTVYVPVFDPAYHDIAAANKRGLREALQRRGTVIELDYVRLDNRERAIREAVDGLQADLLWMQSAETFDPSFFWQLRAYNPGLKIVNWTGDAPLPDDRMIESAKAVDRQLVVNAASIPVFAHAGVKAHLWMHSYEPVDESNLPEVPEYDVVFLGNCRTPARANLEHILRSLPYRVGIYGSGWQQSDGNCQYDFATGYALYTRAKLTISDNDLPDTVSYLSDRPFQALNAGCLVLQQEEPGLDETGIASDAWLWFRETRELPEFIDGLLGDPDFCKHTGSQGQKDVRAHHNFDVRVNQMMELLETVNA